MEMATWWVLGASVCSLAVAVACLAAFAAACGTDYYEIPIETPIQPKLDVTAFQRVLVAGFVAGGSDASGAREPATAGIGSAGVVGTAQLERSRARNAIR